VRVFRIFPTSVRIIAFNFSEGIAVLPSKTMSLTTGFSKTRTTTITRPSGVGKGKATGALEKKPMS